MPRAKGRFTEAGMTLEADISGLIELIAAGSALTGSVKDKRYLDLIVDVAYATADEHFNNEAAAYAASGGGIAHMFEWGTVGINKARTNRVIQPTSPDARLWENFARGHGLSRDLTWVYKPSTAYVPLPTVRDTGMSAAVINQMRRHVFKWKAKVMEEGDPVEITPKRAKFLLIPAYPQNRQFMRPNDVKRGYMLTKHAEAVPGRNSMGKFEAFWFDFWEGRGGTLMDKSIEMQYTQDLTNNFLKANATKSTPKPLYATSIQGAVQRRAKFMLDKAKRNAKVRKTTR